MPHDPSSPSVSEPAAPAPARPAPIAGSAALVEVTRGEMVESRHTGVAVIADPRGRVLDHWGDVERRVYPRSAIKSIQALAIVETGAADAFGVTDEELALACASHSGEPGHVDRIAAWLDRIGCTVGDLECGAHRPYAEAASDALVRSGAAPTALLNNCSGKHAGFLTHIRHQGEPVDGYRQFHHPAQQRVLGILETMMVQDLRGAPRGTDGCSIPTYGVSVGALAVAMARMADPGGHVPDRRVAAIERVRAAWGRHPWLVAGTGRFDTRVMQAMGGRAMVKGGAEAVCCATVPEQGIGIALKIDDGGKRAAEVAMATLLAHVGALDPNARDASALLTPTLTNWNGIAVGTVRPVNGFPV